jgi:Uma2 family endonuclease
MLSICGLLQRLMPGGEVITECPLSTSDGVKAIDVAWLAGGRAENSSEPVLLERAPEICIEIVSPSNSTAELREKSALYSEAGAQEVWICQLDGRIEFSRVPGGRIDRSELCPEVPLVIG